MAFKLSSFCVQAMRMHVQEQEKDSAYWANLLDLVSNPYKEKSMKGQDRV